MILGSERAAVQNPFIRYAQETGWTYLTPKDALRLQRGETGLLLHDVLVSQLIALNPGVVDHQRAHRNPRITDMRLGYMLYYK
ncbi:MAG: hypothetical protein AB1566_07125 [Chloroflexota bacterium]